MLNKARTRGFGKLRPEVRYGDGNNGIIYPIIPTTNYIKKVEVIPPTFPPTPPPITDYFIVTEDNFNLLSEIDDLFVVESFV